MFDPAKKITTVECVINGSKDFSPAIIRINFYSGEELLVAVGADTDWVNNRLYSRKAKREIFTIADDEKLIGCELEHENFPDYDNVVKNFFRGVTWLKMKVKTT